MEQHETGIEKAEPILDMIEQTSDDDVWAEILRNEIGRDQIARIVDACHDLLMKHPDFKILVTEFNLDRLKKIQIHQMLTLGRDFETSEYFNERLNIGHEFARIRFPLHLIQPLYVAIQKRILGTVSRRRTDLLDLATFSDYLMKLFTLDLYLVVKAYRRHDAEEMTKALEDLREEAARLHNKAHMDELTGVCNYSRLMDHLDHQIEAARRRDKPLCVMMSDLDHFKKINDIHGHLAGDEVLRHVAERIESAVRDFDIVGRFGGEEFAIILVNTDRPLAEMIGERIRHEIAAAPIHTRRGNIQVTISIGLAMLAPGDDRDAVVERADRAMYEAKRTGRNRLCVAEDEGTLH